MKQNSATFCPLGALIAASLPAALLPAPAFAQPVTVSAQCNIYSAGHPAPVSSCSTGIGPGILPVRIDLRAGATFVEFRDVAGTVLYCPGCPGNGPDGSNSTSFTFDPLAGISGLGSSSRGRFLEGIFLADAEPADPAPPALSFTDYSFAQLSPLIAQHFYVGDGLTGTGSGTIQRFNIPPGATRLFLGFSDGFPPCAGAWSDNSGAVTATVAVLGCGPGCCIADVDDGSGNGIPDGGVTIDDLLFYLTLFAAGDIRGDIDDGSATGTPDGGVTIDDLLYYLHRFAAGC